LDFVNKTLAKGLVERLFNVKVISVNSSNLPSKKRGIGRIIGYKSNYKKLVLTLLRIL
jgi:large subunit ribosomal protein L23